MAAPADNSALSWSEVATPIAALLARIEGLVAHVAALGAENAALRARVGMLEAEPLLAGRDFPQLHSPVNAARGVLPSAPPSALWPRRVRRSVGPRLRCHVRGK